MRSSDDENPSCSTYFNSSDEALWDQASLEWRNMENISQTVKSHRKVEYWWAQKKSSEIFFLIFWLFQKSSSPPKWLVCNSYSRDLQQLRLHPLGLGPDGAIHLLTHLSFFSFLPHDSTSSSPCWPMAFVHQCLHSRDSFIFFMMLLFMYFLLHTFRHARINSLTRSRSYKSI